MRNETPTLTGMFDVPTTVTLHKPARQTSREAFRQRRAEDDVAASEGRETRQAAALRVVEAYWNAFQKAGTSYELFRFHEESGERVFFDVASFRPRLTELFRDGLIEPVGPRACSVTGQIVRTWRVREIGSREAR